LKFINSLTQKILRASGTAAVRRLEGRGFPEQFPDQGFQFPGSFPVQGIVDPFAFFPASDQPCVAQDLHMMGKGGLGQMEIFQQHAGAPLSALEQFQDVEPVFIAQGLEQTGFKSKIFHLTASFHIDKFKSVICSIELFFRSVKMQEEDTASLLLFILLVSILFSYKIP
jgi:hypothetical protein